MKKHKGLGRGLEVLLGTQSHSDSGHEKDTGTGIVELPLDELATGKYQPRRDFPGESLAELANSIREQGVLQPLIVRPRSPGDGAGYEIVAGERRWRAARLAGLEKVPVVIRELDDQSALAVALIENLQREDLDPLEQARSLARLASEFELTHAEVARAIGRARASVSNLLRLLDLHDDVKALLAEGQLQMGHARALLPLAPENQVAIAKRCSRDGLSVREVEKQVRRELDDAGESRPARPPTDLQTQWLQAQLREELGQKVNLRPARDGTFSLNFAFEDLSQLEASIRRLLDLLGKVRETAGPRVSEVDR